MDKWSFPGEGDPQSIPFLSLYLPLPVEKAPPFITWSKFCQSIWSQWENNREPLEIRATSSMKPGDKLQPFSVAVCRGYSRATIIGFAICQTLLIEDVTQFSDDEKQQFTRQSQSKQVGIALACKGLISDLVLAKPRRIAYGKILPSCKANRCKHICRIWGPDLVGFQHIGLDLVLPEPSRKSMPVTKKISDLL